VNRNITIKNIVCLFIGFEFNLTLFYIQQPWSRLPGIAADSNHTGMSDWKVKVSLAIDKNKACSATFSNTEHTLAVSGGRNSFR